jgi:hypothetical protein
VLGCFTAATATCTATACTPPTASISYATPFCADLTTPQTVSLTGTGTFTGGAYSASPAGLTINATSVRSLLLQVHRELILLLIQLQQVVVVQV